MTELKIVSFNIRTLYSHPLDGVNSFIHRSGMILEKIRKEAPHVICFQEISDPIRAFLRNYLQDYIILGHGRNEDLTGEGLSIAYRKDTMELLGFESFWLSPTPYVPASRYEIQSEYPRICPHAVLKHKDMDKPISLYNIHLDHISDEARIAGIHQITEMAKEYKEKIDCPTFIMGDFNAKPDTETITYLKEYNCGEYVDLSGGIEFTYHGFRDSATPDSGYVKEPCKIDYIFVDRETSKKPHSVTLWDDKVNGILLSDHYPVCLEIEM